MDGITERNRNTHDTITITVVGARRHVDEIFGERAYRTSVQAPEQASFVDVFRPTDEIGCLVAQTRGVSAQGSSESTRTEGYREGEFAIESGQRHAARLREGRKIVIGPQFVALAVAC
jgi:hypothetical protein